MKILGWGLMLVLLAAALAAALQTGGYFQIRRNAVADRQELFHSPSALHVATVLALSPGQELIPSVRDFVETSERNGAKVIYAGQVAVNALRSKQTPDAEWDAFVLAQYPSRDAYEASSTQPDFLAMRSRFASSYALGMKRSPWRNLAIPTGLLGLRIFDIVRGEPSRLPFRKADADSRPPEQRAQLARVVEGLLAHREYGEKAVVVLNFTKAGSASQRDANTGYGLAMLRLMAEKGNGPMHIGEAVTLEGNAEFDDVAIVYYPGVEYFAELIQSKFYAEIVGGKQLGDTLSAPTVPLLPHL